MKTKTIELYTFEELPEDIQEKVLDNERHINVDYEWWECDGTTGFTTKELKRMRLDVKDVPDELITYNHMWFSIDRNWYVQFENARFTDDEVARKFLGVPKKLWQQVNWDFENHNYGGGSCGTTKLTYEHVDYKDFTDKQEKILDRAIERFSDKMEEVLQGLDRSYDYLTSDEAVKETILANKYTFTIDGTMEN